MRIIQEIFSLIKKFFNKEETKLLEANTQNYNSDKKLKFIQSLKIVKTKKSKKIQTLVCDGDGLGIQKKISY